MLTIPFAISPVNSVIECIGFVIFKKMKSLTFKKLILSNKKINIIKKTKPFNIEEKRIIFFLKLEENQK